MQRTAFAPAVSRTRLSVVARAATKVAPKVSQ